MSCLRSKILKIGWSKNKNYDRYCTEITIDDEKDTSILKKKIVYTFFEKVHENSG